MQSFRKTLGFNDLWLIIIGTPIAAVIMTSILFNESLSLSNPLFFGRCILVSIFYVSVYWIAFRFIFVLFRKQFPDAKDIRKRLLLQTGAILLTYSIIRKILKVTIHDYLHDFAGVEHYDPNLVIEPISSLILAFLVISIYEGIYYFKLLNQSILEKEQLQKAHIQSQLQGLKNQVNPHFLFNSLNTLTQLIPEDTDKAIRFVQKLAKTYRYILEIRDEKLICLKEELEFLHAFIYLLKERFGENLNVDIQIASDRLQDKVIPLSLQLLVENAIKHNITSKGKPLYIKIQIENDNQLIVQNNLQLKNQVINSTKLGLENIKKRYQFYSDKLVEVNVTEAHFTVTLPLITTQNLVAQNS